VKGSHATHGRCPHIGPRRHECSDTSSVARHCCNMQSGPVITVHYTGVGTSLQHRVCTLGISTGCCLEECCSAKPSTGVEIDAGGQERLYCANAPPRGGMQKLHRLPPGVGGTVIARSLHGCALQVVAGASKGKSHLHLYSIWRVQACPASIDARQSINLIIRTGSGRIVGFVQESGANRWHVAEGAGAEVCFCTKTISTAEIGFYARTTVKQHWAKHGRSRAWPTIAVPARAPTGRHASSTVGLAWGDSNTSSKRRSMAIWCTSRMSGSREESRPQEAPEAPLVLPPLGPQGDAAGLCQGVKQQVGRNELLRAGAAVPTHHQPPPPAPLVRLEGSEEAEPEVHQVCRLLPPPAPPLRIMSAEHPPAAS
jgi:hypothetical protein